MNDHTSEPWEASGNGIHKRISPRFAECVAITDGPKRKENGKRIVQCVNALAGIDDPAAALDAIREALKPICQPLGDETETSGNPCSAPNPAQGRALLRAFRMITTTKP